MSEPEKPAGKAGVADGRAATRQRSAQVIPLRHREIPDEQPEKLSEAEAIEIVRRLAMDSDNIVIVRYGKWRTRQRKITRPQVEKCVRLGTIQEGPFINQHGHWQMNLFRHAAGEQLTCVVAIDWVTRILVINAF
ncbi:MAG: hypothetical protein FWD68_15800 [Alphaproteobacteria bacterium]|nr:hypothetical protein [Alphaproteobacteria bacterium]